MTTVRDIIQRDLGDEIQSVIKVEETERLLTDLREYVVTPQLAKQFTEVLGTVVGAWRPASGKVPHVGVWVSGFFGSGKSHFAKIVGHLVANTQTPEGTARELFERRLQPGLPTHASLQEMLHQAGTNQVRGLLVPFDIAAFKGSATESPDRIAMKAFYRVQGFSLLVGFAEREMQLREAGLYERFLQLYEERNHYPWAEDQDLSTRSPRFAACLAELLPAEYPTAELAHQSIQYALGEFEGLNPQSVATRLVSWLDSEKAAGRDRGSVFFVADEVGAWAGRNLDRIESVRALVQQFEVIGKGRLWLLSTSQEKLSDVVQNAGVLDQKATSEFLSRLEARFETNVHLEPSGVGTVIEDRVLRKKPAARTALEQLHQARRGWLQDAAAKPGLETLRDYEGPGLEAFIRDYPFLPYQLPMAADIFGAMRGVKVSSGARSMLKVAFEATLGRADEQLGAVVSWDRIFDAANGDNEFADENYLGTPGLAAIARADEDLKGTGALERPSRILKVLWLMQQSNQVPTTTSNLARLLAQDLSEDLLALETDLGAMLVALEQLNYVKRDAASGQWKFLTPDEVTVEKIVTRIAGEIAARDVREEAAKLFKQRLTELGSVTVGRSQTPFAYGVQLNALSVKNESAPVQLLVQFDNLPAASRVRDEYAAYINDASVHWLVPVPDKLDDRLRRIMAIGKLKRDDGFNAVRTAKTDFEADRLEEESAELSRQAGIDLGRALGMGVLYWGGMKKELALTGGSDARLQARPAIEDAIKDRIGLKYSRFEDGDKKFNDANIERLLEVPAQRRGTLDPELGLFDTDGHVILGNGLVTAILEYCKNDTRTNGGEIRANFRAPKFGWPEQLPRYVIAALFVDGQVALVDRTGRRCDNPRAPEARALIRDFSMVRVVVEENPLTPAEANAIRELLGDLGEPVADPGELILHDGARAALQKLERRLGVVEQARTSGLPVPAALDDLRSAMDAVGGAGSRTKSLRALLAHADAFRQGAAAVAVVEDFVKTHKLEQYLRCEAIIRLADKIALEDDPTDGRAVADAKEEIAELKQQRAVIASWTGAYEDARVAILTAYRKHYAPAYEEARKAVGDARAELLRDPAFVNLGEKQLQVRTRYFGAGCALEEIPTATLVSDADLIAAEERFQLPLLRARSEGAARALAAARHLVDDIGNQQPGKAYISWDSSALVGKSLDDEAQVDALFDKAKADIKTLVKQGKIVRVI